MSETTTASKAQEPATEDQTAPASEEVELPRAGDAAFIQLMDALAPESDDEAAPEGEEESATPSDTGGQQPPATEGTGADGATSTPPTTGDGGGEEVQDAGSPEPDPTPEPAAGTGSVDAASLADKWGEVSVALEKQVADQLRDAALADVKKEYPKYFEALDKHPRELVGQQVPSINGKDMETLRDSKDAEEWQGAIKAVLVREVKDRAQRNAEEAGSSMANIHAAIELFQNNPDLVPGTKQFDRKFADRLANLLKPYEHRVDGKLRGYSIPVQPLINQLRETLVAERQAATSPPAGNPPATKKPAAKPAAKKTPQAGIQSKAGASSEEGESFETLFGTLGLPNLRI